MPLRSGPRNCGQSLTGVCATAANETASRSNRTRRISVLGVGGENREFRRKSTVVHFEDRFHRMSDLLAAQFGWSIFLCVTGRSGKLGQDFARINEKHANVVFT